MAASDVREILRGFALKKMEELEKERESEKRSLQTDGKSSKESSGKDSSAKLKEDELPRKQPEEAVVQKDKCDDDVKNSEKIENVKDELHASNKESQGNVSKSEKNTTGKSVIQIKIATKELTTTSSDKDKNESDSDTSSSDEDDDEDDDDDEEEDEEGVDDGEDEDKGKKSGDEAEVPWRELPEEGELTDTSEEGETKDELKKGKESENADEKEKEKKGKKKHKKHKKKSKKKKHKHRKDKNRDKEKENSEKDKNKDRKETGEESNKRKHSHKSKSRSRSRSRSKKHKSARSESIDKVKGHRHSSHRDRHRSRSRERYRYRDSRYKPSSHHEDSRLQRSRSPQKREKTPLAEYDKRKLLEIARANAYAQQQAGLLPTNIQLPPISREEMASQKAGGKTISELTEVCKQISEKQLDINSSDEEPINRPIGSDEEDGQQPFLHHPFQIKSQPLPIVVNIKNAIQKTVPMHIQQDKETLLAQFPVSSGTQHRKKECEYVDPYGQWVVVEKKDPSNKPQATTTTTTPIATQDTENNQSPVTTTESSSTSTSTTTTTVASNVEAAKSTKDEVFPKTQSPSFDISTMVSERLQALRKLQRNPNDVEAMGMMYKANQQIQSWASSNQKPGQFTGSTDAQILSPNELANANPKAQAWAKKATLLTFEAAVRSPRG
ncbi:uncharacterized protein LOC144453977 isoform X2 [Glandiceps talaboti]